MKVTKHRAMGGGWDIHFGGQPTGITISKGQPPKYREGQMYDVVQGDDYLFEARSVHSAMTVLMQIVAALYRAEADKAKAAA